MKWFHWIKILLFCFCIAQAQKAGTLSLGVRTTYNTFSSDGSGWGTGGQIRWQPWKKVNIEGFFDYITIKTKTYASIYYHIGWSVFYYFFYRQPWYFFGFMGHCFDYNHKYFLKQRFIRRFRWGSAIQAGLGSHFLLSQRTDITTMVQYMIHLTPEIIPQENPPTFLLEKRNTLEGHFLIILSINYRIFIP